MKLQQNQVWKQGDLYHCIVRLERLEVEYKTFRRSRVAAGHSGII